VVFTVSATVVTLASWKRFTFAIFSAFSVWPGLTSWLQTADSVHWSTRHTVSTALDRLRHQNARQSTHKTSSFTLNSQLPQKWFRDRLQQVFNQSNIPSIKLEVLASGCPTWRKLCELHPASGRQTVSYDIGIKLLLTFHV